MALAFKGWLLTGSGLIEHPDLEINSLADLDPGEKSFVTKKIDGLHKIRRNCHAYARRNPGVKFATRLDDTGLLIVRIA